MKPPSQPSPFSPETQTLLLTKFDPLLRITSELNDRLQASERDRFRLEKRVERLEETVKNLQAGGSQTQDGNSLPEPVIEGMELDMNLQDDESLIAPWLFSCQTGTPLSALQVLLEFPPDASEELSVVQWNSEAEMWTRFLEELPPYVPLPKPHSTSLVHLRSSARTALLELCKGELLLVLRGVPGRDEAMRERRSITLVAIMAAALSEAWTRVEKTNRSQLGRIAMVLEGDGIGNKLRAGRQKFAIEPLN